jgi:hypothetical protein
MSAVRFILGLEAIDFDQVIEEYYPYQEELSYCNGQVSGLTVRFKKAFIRKRHQYQTHYIVEFVGEAFVVDVVEPTGLRFAPSKKVKLSEQYSFCIDERIYYRRLISKPALGPSPPFSLS